VLQDPRGFVAKLRLLPGDAVLSERVLKHYVAPEVLEYQGMTKKAEVYSFGILMWEVWHARLFTEFYREEELKYNGCVPSCLAHYPLDCCAQCC
jgi:Protein tyrosine and serine/threonine kinase